LSQLAFPFALDLTKLSEFLTRWCAIEDEEERLREDKRLLKEDYAEAFPMRGVLTAIKIVRATAKLEAHPKDGMRRVHLAHLEALVEQHLLGAQAALEELQTAIDAKLASERSTVDMTTGEVHE
jgi:hypothetical protein